MDELTANLWMSTTDEACAQPSLPWMGFAPLSRYRALNDLNRSQAMPQMGSGGEFQRQ
jgi:hypothetical protein